MKDFNHRNRRGFPVKRREDAGAHKAQQAHLLERIKAATELRAKNLDSSEGNSLVDGVSRFRTAIDNLNFRLVDSPDTYKPSAVYSELAAALRRIELSGKSEAILCWPTSNISVAAAFSVAAIASWYDCDARDGNGLSQPRPLRALYFPWAPRTRLPLKNIYVCKSSVHHVHQRHLQRYANGSQASDPMYDLHLALLRVEDLDGSTLEGTNHPEFQHPNLSELVPSGPCNGEDSSRVGLLHRVKPKTQLRRLIGGKIAEHPNSAPYFLYGVRADDGLRGSLRKLPSTVNVVLLDLTKSARRRFAVEWQEPVRRFLAECRSNIPGVPVLAITDDPWVHRDLMWELLKEHEGIKGRKPANNSAVFATTSVIAGGTTPNDEYFKGVEEVRARAFSGNLDILLSSVKELRARAARLQDSEAERLLGELIGLLRRCSNLPGGVRDLGSYVVEEAGDAAAINIMAAYEAPKLLAQLQKLEGPIAQSRREQLTQLCEEAQKTWEAQRQASPMSLLLVDELRPLLRNSSKTAVLFRKSMICDYAMASLARHPEIGPLVQSRCEKGVLRFIDEMGLNETTGLPPRERAQFKAIVLVAPTRGQLLAHMTIPWLPDRVIVLSDADTLRAVARDAHQLSAYPAFSAFAQRLKALSSAAQSAADVVSGKRVVLDDITPPPPDIDFPNARLIDLSGAARSGQERLIRLETDDRQTIIARPRTTLISYDADSAVPTYRPLLAQEAECGDAICVIDDSFIDMARTRLDIRAAATEEIRAYHILVAELFSQISAVSDRARRQELASRINALRTAPSEREVSEENVRYWVDLAEELSRPLEEVTPHAPQDHPTFLRFAAALGLSAQLAESYWQWAVIGTRSTRLRAAHRLHEAYLGILISPHSAESEHPQRVADIRALRAAAEGFVTRVSNASIVERAEICA